MRARIVLFALFASLCSMVVGGEGCNWYGNLWANASFKPSGGVCSMGGGGYGGAGGAGGDPSAGGAGTGLGGSFGVADSASDVGVGAGVGGSFGDAVGASVGAGAGSARSSWDEGHVARTPRHRGRRSADCQPQQNYVPPPPSRMPNWQPLTTTKLRSIAIANNINGCAGQTGITQSRTIGVTFETWVLKTMGQLPRWTKLIPSPERQAANTNNGKGGLPASVIPEFVANQVGVTLGFMSMKTVYFDQSVFFEVKAVTGALTLGTSQYQILGLLDVARSYPPVVPPQPCPPPAVFFTTTGNTTVSPSVVAKAIEWKVGVWQQQVLYDANSANPNNPNLSLGDQVCLNPNLYAGWVASWLAPGPFPTNPLTWPTDQEQASVVVTGDPDPAAVD